MDRVSEDWEDYVETYRQDTMGEFHYSGRKFAERFEPLELDLPSDEAILREKLRDAAAPKPRR